MANWKKITAGFLTLLIAMTIVYITFNNDLRIRIDEDKSTFYVKNDNNRWVVSGREYNSLYDGTTKLNRKLSDTYINTTINSIDNTTTITRHTKYIRGPVIIDTYFFDGKVDDIELFPISHKVEVFNGIGMYYRYDVKDLTYDGDTFKLDGSQTSKSFGRNMKVTWWEGYRLGWIYKSGSMYVKSEKLESDYEVFNVRLFDPPTEISACTIITDPGEYILTADITSDLNSKCIEITANDVTLDCDGHSIVGDDSLDYGIYIERPSSGETTNITIKNCVVSDWDAANIYSKYADGNTYENIIANSSPDYGLYLLYSDSNNIINLTANDNNVYGMRSFTSDNNNFTNVTMNNNANTGFHLYLSDYAKVTNANFINNSQWDVYVEANGNNDCHHTFTNVIGTDNKPILLYNEKVNIKNWNNNVSELIICGTEAEGSTIDNITMSPTDERNNGLIVANADYVNLTNSNFTGINRIWFYYSENGRIVNVTSNLNNFYGLYFKFSDGLEVTNSIFNSNDLSGIDASNSDPVIFYNVTANSNTNDGMKIVSASNSNFTYISVNDNGNDGLLVDGNSITIKYITATGQSDSGDVGIFIDDDNNLLINATATGNYYGIQLDTTAEGNTITNSTITGNTFGLYVNGAGATTPNLIYNNFFNQTTNAGNVKFGTVYANNWNTTLQEGTPIYEGGIKIGGNYWANSTGGHSEICTTDDDGFCNEPYTLETGNIDYLPLGTLLILSVNISLGEGISGIQWRVPFWTGTTAYGVNATGQNSTVGLFKVINNGTATGNLSMRFNDTYDNVTTECAQNNVYTDSIVLNITWQSINESSVPDDEFSIWCRRNYTDVPDKKSVKWEFNFTKV